MRLLLVEDDQILGSSLQKALEKHGYGVDWLQDGKSALAALDDLDFAAMILDINLPKVNGIEVLRTTRRKKNPIPILVLTARDTSLQKVEGLDSGADDYLVKPFDLDELLARLRAALIRRSEGRVETAPAPPATESPSEDAHGQGAPARISWARLLKRVFDVDVEHCPNCGGALKIIAAIDDPPVIVKILSHLGLPTRGSPRAPARRVDLFQTI